MKFRFLLILLLLIILPAGCAKPPVSKTMEATAYCGCGKCCSWERGSWKYLKLNFWNRYYNKGFQTGRPYDGKTARVTVPTEPQPGLFSKDSLGNPWIIPFRLTLPWLWRQVDGTIAADTDYYRFGTRMYVPGWGWGVVEDRGGAIKGPTRIDLFFDNHDDALQWGRRKVQVIIER